MKMRGPGETETATAPGTDEKKDPECASPPCKRLKQAVLPFQSISNSKPVAVAIGSTAAKVTFTNGCETEDESRSETNAKSSKTGGLVIAAPSPTNEPGGSDSLVSDADVEIISSSPFESSNDSNSVNSSRSPINVCSQQSSTTKGEVNGVAVSPPLLAPPTPDNKPKTTSNTPKTPFGSKSAEKLSKEERQRRKAEKEKEKLEKQKLREEKEKQRLEAKLAKEQEKLEAKKKREQERLEKQFEKERREKEKQEEKEKKEKERLEKKEKEEKEHLEKLAKKDEERKKKEEEKNAKLEEKRKLETERRQQEVEQVKKKQKVQQAFASFFTKQVPSMPKTVPKTNDRFKPFEIKPGMTLAPVSRRKLTSEKMKEMDKYLTEQGNLTNYFGELQTRKPLQLQKRLLRKKVETVQPVDQDEIVVIGDDDNSNTSVEIVENTKKSYRAKFLKFRENTRPPYFGTWRKKSKHISPRNPFKKDSELLEYEVDSDDEWEEEEPGESLSHSEGENEGEEGGDDEGDNDGFFVPHGYLSDDEGVEEEEMEEESDSNTGVGDEGKKEKHREQQLQAKVKAWEAELKKKCQPMKPVSIGCLWFRTAEMNTILKQFAACCLVECPVVVDTSPAAGEMGTMEHETNSTTPGSHPSGMYVPEEAMPDLIRLIHGNMSGLAKLRNLFRRQWTIKCLGKTDITDADLEKCPISKRQLERKIQSIAIKEKRGVFDRVRWYVHGNILSMYALDDLLIAENTPDTPSDGRKSPCQNPNVLGMPTIKQFTRPTSPFARSVSPSSLGTEIQSAKTLSSSTQNTSPNGASARSTSLLFKSTSTEAQPMQSIVAKQSLNKNLTKNKISPTAPLYSKAPSVIIIDDDDGNEEHNSNVKPSKNKPPGQAMLIHPANGGASLFPQVSTGNTSLTKKAVGGFESKVNEETEPMDIDG